MAILFRNGNVIVGNGEVIENGTVAVDGKGSFLWEQRKKSDLRKKIRYLIFRENHSSRFDRLSCPSLSGWKSGSDDLYFQRFRSLRLL